MKSSDSPCGECIIISFWTSLYSRGRKWKRDEIRACHFTAFHSFSSAVIMKDAVAGKKRAACRSTLLYFSRWVPWIRLIQRSKLVSSHWGAWQFCEGNLLTTYGESDAKGRSSIMMCPTLPHHNKPAFNKGGQKAPGLLCNIFSVRVKNISKAEEECF